MLQGRTSASMSTRLSARATRLPRHDLFGRWTGSLFQNAINRAEGAGTGSRIRQGSLYQAWHLQCRINIIMPMSWSPHPGNPENRASGVWWKFAHPVPGMEFSGQTESGVPFQNNFATGTAVPRTTTTEHGVQPGVIFYLKRAPFSLYCHINRVLLFDPGTLLSP